MRSKASTVSVSHATGGPCTLLRHWSWAIDRASSWVGAQLRWICSRAGPRPPASRYAASTFSRTSRGWLTVMRASAHSACRAAVAGVTAGPTSGGTVSGRVHSRPRLTVTRPSWLTSSPASSRRMTSTHSRRRSSRTSLRGQTAPVTRSLAASPEPERGPEATGEHLRERRDRLRRDGGVVALAGRRDDAEGQRRRGEGGPEERPRVAGLALPGAPRSQVVGRHARGEAGLLRVLHVAQQGGGVDLLVGTVKTDDSHADTQPDLERCRQTPARPLRALRRGAGAGRARGG